MKIWIKSMFIVLLSMTGLKVFAHDFEAPNADGKTIYYIYNSDGTTVSVSYRGSCSADYINRYDGDIVIPESVTYNENTFSVTSIGYEAFIGCSGLTSITIPNSVTSIDVSAFEGCSGLTSVTIPNSVTSIGNGAFYGCHNLASIIIPHSVTNIERTAFSCCRSLTSIVVESDNTIYDSREGCNAIIKTNTNELVAGCKNTIIPNNVTSIGCDAFYHCSGLTSITIPNSVTNIEKSAFHSCYDLTSVIIPNSVTSIGGFAFNHCYNLRSVTIPNSITSISNGTFDDCSSLTSITIPSSVTSIGEYAFSTCTRLKDVYCNAEVVPKTMNYAFFNTPINEATLHVPQASISAYNAASPWDSFKSIIALTPTNITTTIIGKESEITESYLLSGQRNSLPQKGINIIRMSNGKTMKIVIP